MILLHSIVSVLLCLLAQQGGFCDDSLEVMFWNLENFFDYRDGGYSESDAEFSSFGGRHWSKKKFEAKCNAVAKTILWVADRDGRLPPVVAVAEVENRYVLWCLLNKTALRKTDYAIVHYDSPDPRGIDVALLYRTSILDTIATRAVRVKAPPNKELRTRDILLARFRTKDSLSFSVLVNHHPSKYGGGDTDWKRRVAVETLRTVCDSLKAIGEGRIIATGDFNDGAENPVLAEIASESEDDNKPLINLAIPLAKKGLGTIRFDGKWELIDMFLVSPSLKNSRMEILTIPFLIDRDAAHSGDKPLRTYTGPRYKGGVSDHIPILLHLPY